MSMPCRYCKYTPTPLLPPRPPAKVAITSKDKRHAFGPFGDVYEEIYGAAPCDGEALSLATSGRQGGTGPPPTFLVPLLHPHFLGQGGEGLSRRCVKSACWVKAIS